MLIGQTVMRPFAASEKDPTKLHFFTPWMPRRGNNVTSTIEVIVTDSDQGLTPALGWELYTKDSEDTGDGTAITPSSGTSAATAPGVHSWRCENCKELVRYRFSIGATGTPASAGATYAHFRFLSPVWETTGAQSI